MDSRLINPTSIFQWSLLLVTELHAHHLFRSTSYIWITIHIHAIILLADVFPQHFSHFRVQRLLVVLHSQDCSVRALSDFAHCSEDSRVRSLCPGPLLLGGWRTFSFESVPRLEDVCSRFGRFLFGLLLASEHEGSHHHLELQALVQAHNYFLAYCRDCCNFFDGLWRSSILKDGH